MFKNLFGKKVGTAHIVEVTINEEGKNNKFSFETKPGREEVVIETLKETKENFDDIIKISFIEKDIFVFRDKIFTRKRFETKYFVGEKISLIEYNSIKNKEETEFDRIMNLDDYQTSAIRHVKTGQISPLYPNDHIVEPIVKTKTIRR